MERKSKQQKRDEHHQRVGRWQHLSLTEQLQDLDRRFGKGQGAQKQRERIARELN